MKEKQVVVGVVRKPPPPCHCEECSDEAISAIN